MEDDSSSDPLEQVRFLARSESRVQIVEHLLGSGPASQRALRTNVDASRTTVSRSLQSLVEVGWVEDRDGTYRLTPAGRIVAREFTRTLDAVRSVEELSEFLHWFPEDVEAPDLLEAGDIDVTTSTDADPYAPARTQSEILFSADRLRMLLPAIDLESTEAIAQQVTDRGLEVETVVSPGVEATIESDGFAELVGEKVRTGRSTILVSPEPLPFYLGLAADGRVQVGLADDEGIPRVLLETDDDGVRGWAEGVYRGFREGARHKPPEEFDLR